MSFNYVTISCRGRNIYYTSFIRGIAGCLTSPASCSARDRFCFPVHTIAGELSLSLASLHPRLTIEPPVTQSSTGCRRLFGFPPLNLPASSSSLSTRSVMRRNEEEGQRIGFDLILSLSLVVAIFHARFSSVAGSLSFASVVS